MLHILHMIERRFGQGPRPAGIISRKLLASFAVLLLGAGVLLSGNSQAQDAPPPTADASTLAIQMLDHLDAGDYARAEAMFNSSMAQAVPADKLQAVWESLPAQAGEAQGRGQATIAKQGQMTLVTIPLKYAKTGLVAKIAIDGEGKIAGFVVQPEEAPPVPAAAVSEDAPYTESDLMVGEGERALPGTLAMPKGVGLFPAVVLVHGSGPHDRDETVGPNKPFLDIARGLAAQGVAVLRYEKRTKARPQDFTVKSGARGVYGVDDETTNDAVLAVDTLRNVEGIDPARVFVLGHSQGGLMAPRIAAMSGHVAGLVLMAAPARSLLDLVIEQNRRLAVLDDGKTSDAERDAINALIQQVATTRDAATDASTKTLMGMPAGYWRSIDSVDPVAEAKSVDLPMLVLQGARDIQVVDADWQLWRSGFHDDKQVTFKLYDALNHLGIAGEGEGSIAEYANPGHVDAQLIDDVTAWIKAH